MKTPNSATNLGKAIKRYCGKGRDDIRLARAMADLVVGQMLPGGVVKGGSSLLSCWMMMAFIKSADNRRDASFAVRAQLEDRDDGREDSPDDWR